VNEPRESREPELTPLPPPVVDEHLASPTVTYVLMAVTAVIYILQFGSQALLGGDVPAYLGMKINELILAGQLWRFFTPMLLHGSILHIGFNMYALLRLGAPLERRFGNVRFLLLYLAGAFAGNVFSFLLSESNSLGASTAIFGLLGAELVFLYQNRQLLGKQANAGIQNVIQIAVINLLIGLTPGIDNWGHLGGLCGGLLFTWFAGPLLKVEGIYPKFDISDERAESMAYIAAALTLAVFGALAATKFVGWWPL